MLAVKAQSSFFRPNENRIYDVYTCDWWMCVCGASVCKICGYSSRLFYWNLLLCFDGVFPPFLWLCFFLLLLLPIIAFSGKGHSLVNYLLEYFTYSGVRSKPPQLATNSSASGNAGVIYDGKCVSLVICANRLTVGPLLMKARAQCHECNKFVAWLLIIFVKKSRIFFVLFLLLLVAVLLRLH